MNKAHTNVNWENLPSTNTPLNQQNLNQMDHAIDEIDDRVIVHDNEITQLQGYETRAAQSATEAANSASTASTKATDAATSATNSENFYKYSKSYAVGGTGIRSGEDTDNSKYYYEQVKSMSSGGHSIMDPDGTAMAGRSILQFANSRVKDDATNDKTIVAPAHTLTNLLNPTLATTTANGVTCTANGDGTYTLNGTAESQPNFKICSITGVSGKFKLLGCPSGGGVNTHNLSYTIDGTWSGNYEIGDGLEIDLEADKTYAFYPVVRAGQTVSNLTFKPMLTTDLSATYDDFVQYSGDGELNENVAALHKGLESTDANLADVQSQIVTSGNIESGNTATSAHTVGTYIQWKGKFYTVTAAIAVGDTLAVGTNLTAKTVGEVLTQINSDLSATYSWTPTLYYKNQSAALEYTRTNSRVLKIGHMVMLSARFEITSVGSGSGLRAIDFSGAFPFTPGASSIGQISFNGKSFPLSINADGTYAFVGKGTTTGDAESSDIATGPCILSIVYSTEE